MTNLVERMNAMTETLKNLSPEQVAFFKQCAAQAEQASSPKALTMKVSEKGALSIYGLGRFPVTLYRGQWERLLAAKPTIEAFIEANASLLSVKA
jgi:hypothetical protein